MYGIQKRKVNLVGQNTLTVSLPNEFVKENVLKKGDELITYVNQNEVIFSLEAKKNLTENKEIYFDATNYSSYMLTTYLTFLYLTGYKKIILDIYSSHLYDYKNEKFVEFKNLIKNHIDKLLGAEIIYVNSKKIEIEFFLSEEPQSLNKVEKQIHFLIKEAGNFIIDSVNQNLNYFHNNVYELYKNIDKFINYYLRLVDFSEKSNIEKRNCYAFYTNLKVLINIFNRVSEKIHLYSCSEKVKNYLEEIFSVLEEEFMAIHKGKIKEELVKKKCQLVRKIDREDFEKDELRTILEAKRLIDSIGPLANYTFSK